MSEPDTIHVQDHGGHTGWLASVQSLAVTVVIALFIITFLVQAFQIPSESMEGTLLTGDYLLVDKVHFAGGGAWDWMLPYRGVQRGDIVVFRYPVRPAEHFVKRVVALPGDHVRLLHKRLLINGRPLEETYVQHTGHGRDPFRDHSLDSRYWGFVPRENIVGRPLVIYWSVADPSPYEEEENSVDGKLSRLAYSVSHFFRGTRWDRAFRRVD